MIDFESRLSKVETEVAAIREKVSFFSVIYEKFDKTLDKLDERTIEDKKELHDMMNQLRGDIMKEIKEMREEVANQHVIQAQKIEELNTWRWVIVGGAAVVGWIISTLTNISFSDK
jgi:molybdopterin converting factor small subunit